MGSRQTVTKEELPGFVPAAVGEPTGLYELYEQCKKAKHEGLTCYRCQAPEIRRFHVECKTCNYNASNHSGTDLRGDSKPNVGPI